MAEDRSVLPAAVLIRNAAFVTISVVRPDRALNFWKNVVGLELEMDSCEEEHRWITLQLGTSPTLLHLEVVAKMPDTKHHAMSLMVYDVCKTVDALKAQDVEIFEEPGPAPWCPSVMEALFMDSEGNRIVLQDKNPDKNAKRPPKLPQHWIRE